MEKQKSQLEKKKINRLVNIYKKKGYHTFFYSEIYDNEKRKQFINILDKFNKYIPDLIIKKDGHVEIFEVKSKSTSANNIYIDFLQNISEKNKWVFNLIYTNPKELNHEDLVISIDKLENKLKEAKKLHYDKYDDASFIILWSVFEGLSRRILAKMEDEDSNRLMNTNNLIRKTHSYGFFNYTQYNKIKNYFNLRNSIVHGLEYNQDTKRNFEEFYEIILKLLDQEKNNMAS